MIDGALVKLVGSNLCPGPLALLEEDDFAFECADRDCLAEGWICPADFPDGCIISEWMEGYALNEAVLLKCSFCL